MKILEWPLALEDTLYDYYIHDYSRVASLFSYSPYESDSFLRRYRKVVASFALDRGRLVEALHSYNRAVGAGSLTMFHLEKLLQPEAVAVVTGQQAGIFTGPLYTIYKTITAVSLAQRLEEDLQVPVVPVFWIASEDHDWEEVNHINFVDRNGRLRRQQLDCTPTKRISVGNIWAKEDMEKALQELVELTPEGPWKETIVQELQGIIRRSSSLAEAFSLIMNYLFRQYGLIFLDPMLPELRRLQVPVFLRAVKQVESVNRALIAVSRRIEEMGMVPALQKEPDHAHLFYYHEGERRPLFINNGALEVRGPTVISFALEEIERLIADRPWDFSPDVVLRPVVQDYLLPTVAYVAGPGEIAYLAQLREVHQMLSQELPVIYPRFRLTLLSSEQHALLHHFNLDPGKLMEDWDSCQKQVAQRLDEIGISAAFDRAREGMRQHYRSLLENIKSINPNLEKLSEKNWSYIDYQLKYLEKKAWQYHRRNYRSIFQSLEEIRQLLFPRGRPQEMVLNGIPYLFKYGPGLVRELLENLALESFEHKLVILEEEGNGKAGAG